MPSSFLRQKSQIQLDTSWLWLGHNSHFLQYLVNLKQWLLRINEHLRQLCAVGYPMSTGAGLNIELQFVIREKA